MYIIGIIHGKVLNGLISDEAWATFYLLHFSLITSTLMTCKW